MVNQLLYIFLGIFMGILIHQYLDDMGYWEPNIKIFHGHIDDFKAWVYKQYGAIYQPANEQPTA